MLRVLPELDANADAVAIRQLKLENNGRESNYSISAPAQPSFDEPSQ